MRCVINLRRVIRQLAYQVIDVRFEFVGVNQVKPFRKSTDATSAVIE